MTYAQLMTKATEEEREEVRSMVQAIIGTQEQARATATNLSDRIKKGMQWQRQYEKLAKIFLENGGKALAMNFTQEGRRFKGVTASGKHWTLYGNCGWTDRSRYCGTLYIEGEGCIFTSGRLDRVFDYILNN